MSTTPHDALFKKVFSRIEHAASALRTLLPPAIAARIDFSALTLRPGSFVDQQLATSHSDLLFSASITGQPRFRFVLEDVSLESDEALRARGMTPLGRLALWCFRHARQPHELVRRLGAWLELVQEVRRAPDGRAALALIWRYILTISDRREPDALLRGLLAAAGPESKEEIVSVADYLEEKGRLKGKLEGQRSMLLELLGVRFGELPEGAVSKIQAADAQHLKAWSLRLLTAPTLADVLGDD